MKNILKTFGLHLGVFSVLVLSFGIAYAAWDSAVSTGEQLTASSWNEVVNRAKAFNVDGSGNVGIGTINPGARLEIAHSGAGRVIGTNTRDNSWALWLQNEGGGYGGFYDPAGGEKGSWLYLHDGNDYRVKIAPSGNSFLNAGNVGIGTTTPLTKLHIKAAINHGVIIDNPGVDMSIYEDLDNPGWGIYRADGGNGIALSARPDELNLVVKSSNGNVGIGTNNPVSKLDVANSINIGFGNDGSLRFSNYGYGDFGAQILQSNTAASSGRNMVFNNYGGHAGGWKFANSSANSGVATITAAGSMTLAGTLSQNSDRRLKKDIIELEDSLPNLMKINAVKYRWKDTKARGNDVHIGLIAQELEDIYPELVSEDDEGILSVNYNGLIAPIINAMKEQQKQIQNLEEKNKIMEKELKFLKTK